MGNSAGQWYVLKVLSKQDQSKKCCIIHIAWRQQLPIDLYSSKSRQLPTLARQVRLCTMHASMVHATHSSCSSAMVSLESGRNWFVTTITPTSDMCDTAASACCRVKLLTFSLLKCLMVPAANANRRKLRLVQSSTTCVHDDAITNIQEPVSENLAG